jgi:CubicO group peptidase (beta-lactamase class C family)
MKPLLCWSVLALLMTPKLIAGSSLPRSTPEAQGISSAAVLDFVQAADREVDAMNSFMLVRHGHVVAEAWWAPYDPQSRHTLYSLSKSFTSTAVGLAIADGKLSLDDEVVRFFPDEVPDQPSANLSAMRVRDLLSMSTGHQTEPNVRDNTNTLSWTKAFLSHPVPHKPGTHFLYNTAATYMQSAIVQKVTGKTVLEYLRPRLFEPLGIEDPSWGASPQGVTLGGYGLSIRTEDIARFGLLLLQNGRWESKQLVPAAWVEAATAKQTSNGSNPRSDWDQGYGYQFWRCRHHAYRGDGAFGQFCIVIPEKDAVVAITSGTKDMQAVMNLVWEKLLPALGSGALPPNNDGLQTLKGALAHLSVRTPQGASTSAATPQVTGRKYVFPSNQQKLDSLVLERGSDDKVILTISVNGTEYRVPSGNQTWEKSQMAYGPFEPQPVAAAGAWTSQDTYTVRFCFYETPTCITAQLKFGETDLTVQAEYNVAFGPTKEPTIIGKVP